MHLWWMHIQNNLCLHLIEINPILFLPNNLVVLSV